MSAVTVCGDDVRDDLIREWSDSAERVRRGCDPIVRSASSGSRPSRCRSRSARSSGASACSREVAIRSAARTGGERGHEASVGAEHQESVKEPRFTVSRIRSALPHVPGAGHGVDGEQARDCRADGDVRAASGAGLAHSDRCRWTGRVRALWRTAPVSPSSRSGGLWRASRKPGCIRRSADQEEGAACC